GVEHRTAPVDRPAVTVDPDDVDVRGPDRDAFLEDLGALVDHREDAALEDLLLGDLARLLAGLGHEVADDLLGDGRRTRLAVLVVVVVAGAGLLATTIHLRSEERRVGKGASKCRYEF